MDVRFDRIELFLGVTVMTVVLVGGLLTDAFPLLRLALRAMRPRSRFGPISVCRITRFSALTRGHVSRVNLRNQLYKKVFLQAK